MSEKKAKRRLFNIKTDEVSLVDLAANQRKFLIVKNKEGIEVEEILKKIESALNSLITEVAGIKKKQEDLEKSLTLSEDELKKAGAKFSKETLGQLRNLRDALNKLLSGTDDTGDDNDNKDMVKSLEEMGNILSKSISAAMKEEDKKPEDATEALAKAISDAVSAALKANQDK
jgi:hypothetical protein